MARRKSTEGVTTTATRRREKAPSSGTMMMSGSYNASGRGTATMTCTADQIRERAYYIYLERQQSNRSGDPVSDWCQAEHELNGDYDTIV